MKYLKLYENFEDIDEICRKYDIGNYTINQDGTVDADEVNLEGNSLSKLPLKFGKVYAGFWCGSNNLISLKGSPKEVNGVFGCSYNQLTTLIGGPKIVHNEYLCRHNNLKDMIGFPEYFTHTLDIGDYNTVSEIIDLVHVKDNVKFVKWLNEYDVIRDGNKIVEMRLEEAYYMTTKTELPWNKRRFKNYTLL